MSYFDEEIITVLSTEECWDALRTHELGRLAYRLGDEVNITPVNYAVDGLTLLFATAEGSKLLGIVMNPEVAFEVDEYDDEFAQSVVVRGRARLMGEHEAHRADDVPLRPWIDTLAYNVVEIVPARITGRRFRLDRRPAPGAPAPR